MIILLQILFWLSFYLIIYTYIFYPVIVIFLASLREGNKIYYQFSDEVRGITIVMAVHNEEEVLIDKLKSIFNSDFNQNKIEVLIGSDNSTDKTNDIIREYQKKHPNINIYLTEFTERQGKISIINQLVPKAKYDILMLTDANVLLDKHTIFELCKHFKNPNIGLVDTNMINIGLKNDGISVQEKTYIQNEVRIKNAESILWGTMMGPFGGCYAIRKELYCNVPSNYLVDDFYICMQVLQQKKQTINELNAMVFEDVSNDLREEFRRKVRISTGNFQNLKTFSHFLYNPFSIISFIFISHKVLRWFIPWILLIIIISNFLLYDFSLIYKILMYGQIVLLVLPIIDIILSKFNVHNKILRFFLHFYSMNLALFIGLFKYLSGVKTSIWEPTKRKQTKTEKK